MFKKWIHDLDREFKTVAWLECKSVVEGGLEQKLKCTLTHGRLSTLIDNALGEKDLATQD